MYSIHTLTKDAEIIVNGVLQLLNKDDIVIIEDVESKKRDFLNFTDLLNKLKDKEKIDKVGIDASSLSLSSPSRKSTKSPKKQRQYYSTMGAKSPYFKKDLETGEFEVEVISPETIKFMFMEFPEDFPYDPDDLLYKYGYLDKWPDTYIKNLAHHLDCKPDVNSLEKKLIKKPDVGEIRSYHIPELKKRLIEIRENKSDEVIKPKISKPWKADKSDVPDSFKIEKYQAVHGPVEKWNGKLVLRVAEEFGVDLAGEDVDVEKFMGSVVEHSKEFVESMTDEEIKRYATYHHEDVLNVASEYNYDAEDIENIDNLRLIVREIYTNKIVDNINNWDKDTIEKFRNSVSPSMQDRLGYIVQGLYEAAFKHASATGTKVEISKPKEKRPMRPKEVKPQVSFAGKFDHMDDEVKEFIKNAVDEHMDEFGTIEDKKTKDKALLDVVDEIVEDIEESDLEESRFNIKDYVSYLLAAGERWEGSGRTKESKEEKGSREYKEHIKQFPLDPRDFSSKKAKRISDEAAKEMAKKKTGDDDEAFFESVKKEKTKKTVNLPRPELGSLRHYTGVSPKPSIDKIILHASKPLWGAYVSPDIMDKLDEYPLNRNVWTSTGANILEMNPSQIQKVINILNRGAREKYYIEIFKSLGFDPSRYSDSKIKTIVNKYVDHKTGKNVMADEEICQLFQVYDEEEKKDVIEWFERLPKPKEVSGTFMNLYNKVKKWADKLQLHINDLEMIEPSAWKELDVDEKKKFLPPNTKMGRKMLLKAAGFKNFSGNSYKVMDRLLETLLSYS